MHVLDCIFIWIGGLKIRVSVVQIRPWAPLVPSFSNGSRHAALGQGALERAAKERPKGLGWRGTVLAMRGAGLTGEDPICEFLGSPQHYG
jgi:hypothetical protein